VCAWHDNSTVEAWGFSPTKKLSKKGPALAVARSRGKFKVPQKVHTNNSLATPLCRANVIAMMKYSEFGLETPRRSRIGVEALTQPSPAEHF
jgi:hypothetical protein